MAKLSKVDAAKAAGVSRQTLYTYLKDGRLSAGADGLIDTAELLRAGFTLHTGHEIRRQDVMSTGQELTSKLDTVGQPVTSRLDTLDVYLDMITMLKQQLSEAQTREQDVRQAALERERDYRDHIARLTAMLDQAHQQNQRLLDLPRTPPQSLQDAPGHVQPLPPPGTAAPPQRRPTRPHATSPGDPRGAMRRRILSLLQDYPEGLTPAEIRERLGVERSLGDTCLGMLRYGLVRRVARGRYVAAPSAYVTG